MVCKRRQADTRMASLTPVKNQKQGKFMKIIAAIALAVGLAGCATIEIPSKLYNMKNGKILTASFLWRGDVFGPTTITTDKETCTGEYRTIIEGKMSVGAGSAVVGPWGGIFGSLYSSSSTERAQKGMALAVCPSGVTFECEYVTNVAFTTVTGHGACKDNQGEAYRLMF